FITFSLSLKVFISIYGVKSLIPYFLSLLLLITEIFEKSLLKKYLSAIILLINCSSFWSTSRGSFSILISLDTLCKAIF
ncbi:hypothetical protein, partial [Francisella tularensis]|uniref:hypothetical protein n=1 Tax=Francisella tularensis TaxID=263 RepID=UPI002381C5D0